MLKQPIAAQKGKNDMQRIKPYAQYALAILGIAAFDLVRDVYNAAR
jgi:hypothetical protein